MMVKGGDGMYLEWLWWQIDSMWPRKEILNPETLELITQVIYNEGRTLEYIKRLTF